MFKNALVSVSNKEGLVNFLRPLVEQGLRLVSTGGTSRHLREAGFQVIDVSEQTGFPEVMDGRVKTLHPRIHMALLARLHHAADDACLQENQLEPFDLVIGNLYPFEQALGRGAEGGELIEFIDIGGPSFLRAAAKSFERITVLCQPEDYPEVSKKLEQQDWTVSDRKKMAAKVFQHTAHYDALIAQTLDPDWGEQWSFGGRRHLELRYGENPHQAASWYRRPGMARGLHEARILQGKPLSYNNLLDLEAASSLCRQWTQPAVVAVKHNNTCGAALGKDITEATKRALLADPVSVFGGIVAINQEVSADAARNLSEIFLECIVAPGFSEEALEVLGKKKNLRLLEWTEMLQASESFEVRSLSGGFLLQSRDQVTVDTKSWQIHGAELTAEVRGDLEFAWRLVASLKSNGIAIASEKVSVGLGMGQVNRVDAVAQAIARMQKYHPQVKSPVLASDAFFPFVDSVILAAEAGIKYIIQPGGSVKDQEVFAKAQELGVTMVLTGQRHFRH